MKRSALAPLLGFLVGMLFLGDRIAAAAAVVVGPDEAAIRATNVMGLSLEVQKALDDAAIAARRVLGDQIAPRHATLYLRDDARFPNALATLRLFASKRGDIIVSVSPAEVDHISFTARYLASASIDEREMDTRALERFVRDARDEAAGVDVHRDLDGVTVRTSDPTQATDLEDELKEIAPEEGWRLTAGPDRSWRLTGPPSVANAYDFLAELEPDTDYGDLGPGRQLLLPEALEYEIRDRLRTPRDLATLRGDDGVLVMVPASADSSSFSSRLQRTFAGNAKFRFESIPAQAVRIDLKAPERPASASARSAPSDFMSQPDNIISTAAGQARLLVDQPASIPDITPADSGVLVRPGDPFAAPGSTSRAILGDPPGPAEAARLLRDALAGHSDLTVAMTNDNALRVTFTDAPLEPSAEDLAGSAQACLRALNIEDGRIITDADKHVQVILGDEAQARAFRLAVSKGCGFSIRVVDSQVEPDSTQPPAPDDTAFPDVDGQTLWLRPGELITADMVGDASVGEGIIHQPAVRFQLTPDGRARLAAFTSRGVGQRFAVIFNGVVVSAPTIFAPITDGGCEITGALTVEKAEEIVRSLRRPGPGVPLRPIEVQPGAGDHVR